ncbi:MAG: hypothetical protein HOK97_07710, partial [Deltaproteobacteria bacterium]|nr:hypothetical protein [Deltaproteobacteria bacterium]
MRRAPFTFWLSFLWVICVHLGFQAEVKAAAPSVVEGTIDVQNWDPSRDGALGLNGEWGFFWNELVS